MSSEIAIRVENLGKCYYIYQKPLHRLLEFLFPKKKYGREFWALQNVSFEVKRGETFGIIGRNGSGKSTLLQLISGTLNESTGKVFANGRVAALLELGAGFNPEFTGRDNVLMAASIYGLAATELEHRFKSIVEFAEIGDFIDQPVKTYSSGMYVRLAFSVIAHVDADILIVDEALSVGDVRFQQKCIRFLKEFKSNGGTLLFVSHDSAMVMALCEKALYLNRTSEEYSSHIGFSDDICKEYLKDIYDDRQITDSSSSAGDQDDLQTPPFHDTKNDVARESTFSISNVVPSESIITISNFRRDSESFGDGGGRVTDVEVRNSKQTKATSAKTGDHISIVLSLRANRQINNPVATLILKDRAGQFLFSDGTVDAFINKNKVMMEGDLAEVTFTFQLPELIEGTYSLDIIFTDGTHFDHVVLHWLYDGIEFKVARGRNVVGICGFPNLKFNWHLFPGNNRSLI